MAVLLSDTDFSAQDITSEYVVVDYQAVRDSLVWIYLHLTQLNGAAANITIKVYQKLGPNQRETYSLVRAKPADADTSFVFNIPYPFFVEDGSYIRVSLQSSNGSDSSCGGNVRISDPYAHAYSAGDLPQVDIAEVGASAAALANLLALLDGTGYAGGTIRLDVNVVTVVGGAPLTAANIESECGDALDSRDLHLVADASGRVDVVKIEGSDATDQINAAVDTAFDTAIPSSPTANSINERIKAIDELTEAYGDGDLAAVLEDTYLNIPAMQDVLDVLLRTILDSSTMAVTTVATLASQISFTLAAGPIDDDACNGCVVILKSVSTPARKAVGIISDYAGSSKTITLAKDPGIFTLNVGDEVIVITSAAFIVNLIRADKVIDTTGTPWVVDYKEEGTEEVLMSKTMQNTAGANITTENNVLGQLEKE